MPQRIIIDAGHGGYDKGASFQDRLEKDDNLRLALQVGRDLADLGYDVLYTRDSDVYQSPSLKAQIANEAGADLFVSLHRNSSPETNMYEGAQTLVFDDNGIKAAMAQNVTDALAKIGFKNLGISIRPNLTVLRKTKMPAILVETGFINNEKDNQLFDEHFSEIAQAIAQGIHETLSTTSHYTKDPTYRIQVGLYRNYNNAVRQANKLQADGYPAHIIPSGPYFAVQTDSYSTLEEAAAAARNLRLSGYETLVITHW